MTSDPKAHGPGGAKSSTTSKNRFSSMKPTRVDSRLVISTTKIKVDSRLVVSTTNITATAATLTTVTAAT